MIDLNNEQAALISRLVYLNEKAARLAQDIDDTKALLRDLGPGEYYHNGAKVLDIVETRRFNADRAKTLLPPEVLARITVQTIDTKLAKALLPANLYDLCKDVAGKAAVKAVTE